MPAEPGAAAGASPSRGPVGWAAVLRDRWIHASVASFVYWLALEALRPMVALQLDAIGASGAAIGVAVAAYALLGLALAVPGGVVVDRVGPGRLLVGGFTGLVVCGGLYLLTASSVVGLTLVQLATGAAALAVWVSLQTSVTYAGTDEVLRRHLAVFTTAWAAGAALGPLVGSWLFAHVGFDAVAGVLVAGGVVGMVVSLRIPTVATTAATTGRRVAGGRTRVGELVADPTVRLVLVASFVSLAVQSLRTSFLPLYLVERGASVRAAGLVLMAIGVASLAVRPLLPALARRTTGRRLLIGTTWLAIVALAATPLLAGGAGIAVVALAIGVSLGLNPPTTVELMAGATPADLRGLAMGLRVAANRSAQVVQPLLFGVVVAAVGYTSAFVITGASLAALFASGRGRRRTVRADGVA